MQTHTRTVHIAPHFHYDVAYLTPESECLHLGIANLVRALDLLDQYPEYCFMIEQIYLLEQLLNRRPGELERLSRHIESGRLDIAGGLYVMSDMNQISGESIIAQIRLGREVAASLGLPDLNDRVRVCWISDCWGHPFQMPQIASGCGYTSYAFCRGMLPAPGHPQEPLLPSEFIWDGPADSEIIALWMPEGYGPVPFMPEWFGGGGPPGALEVIQNIATNAGRYSDIPVVLLGNGGDNAPPQATLLGICRDADNIHISTPTRFAEDVALHRDRLRHFAGEFNSLFQGTYSARIPIKQRNRQLENLLETVRRYRAVVRDNRAGVGEQVRHAERLIAKQQVHDVIAGSTCDEVYRAAMREFGEAEDMLLGAGGLMQRQALPTLDEQHWFNPSAFPRREIIDTRWRCDGVTSGQDEALPVQQTFDGRTICAVTVPPLQTVTLRPSSHATPPREKIVFNGETLTNRFWKMTFSPAGGITSLVSTATGREFVDGHSRCSWNTLVFQWDMGDVYMHDAQPLDTRGRASWFATPRVDPLPSRENTTLHQTAARYSCLQENVVELLEAGPLRFLMRVTGCISVWRVRVQFAQYIAAYPDDPRIDFHTEIVPSGKHYRLRVAFPTSVRDGVCRHETAFGHVARGEGEHPALRWMDYRDEDGGLCLLNYGLPGNAVCDDVMLLSLFRSVGLEYKCESDLAFGTDARHWFDYAVIPIDGHAPYDPSHSGEQFNRPLCPVSRPAAGGPIIEGEGIMLSYWDGEMLRLYEANGIPGHALVTLGTDLAECHETDMLGRPTRRLPLEDGRLQLTFAPFQVRTLRYG